MEQFKRAQVILLPTTNNSNIVLSNNKNYNKRDKWIMKAT